MHFLPLLPKTELITIAHIYWVLIMCQAPFYFACLQPFNSHNSVRWALLSSFSDAERWRKSQWCLVWGTRRSFFPAGRALSVFIDAEKDWERGRLRGGSPMVRASCVWRLHPGPVPLPVAACPDSHSNPWVHRISSTQQYTSLRVIYKHHKCI